MRIPTAVIAVFAHAEHLSANELLSLRQCVSIFYNRVIWLIVPEDIDVSAYQAVDPKIIIKRFLKCHFDGVIAYNRFKISQSLYDAIDEFDFLLTYELDGFVFRDELEFWMRQGYDYIGAPWFEGFSKAAINASPFGVGNSGFSLRRIDSCQIVIRKLDFLKRLRNFAIKAGGRGTTCLIELMLSKVLGKELTNVLSGRHIQEDLFWSFEAPKLSKHFKIPSYEIAREFSFETNPSRMYGEIGRLPFGCHAWARYEPEFWKRHIPTG